jgi:hypothetical protein
VSAALDLGARVAALCAVAPHAGTAHHLATAVEGPVVVALLPESAEATSASAAHATRAVQAYDLLATHLEPDAHLIVVGALGERDHVVLQEWLRRSNLPAGWLAGDVDDDVRVAFLERADVALVDPADEAGAATALAFGLPVVGGPAAVVGDAGLALGAGEPLVVWAEAIGLLLARPAVRAELGDRARRRNAEAFALPA